MSALTIFVRSLPVDACNDRLEEIFSEIGPVNHYFVVKEKGEDKCRGFGYVTYSMEEDAQHAVREVKVYDGQKINVSVAKKKLPRGGFRHGRHGAPAHKKIYIPNGNICAIDFLLLICSSRQ
uniref:RRM domain-containing protein n=1 Tax=Salmo trutta TaxID=8032 RepID=A0A674BXY4_SALTR